MPADKVAFIKEAIEKLKASNRSDYESGEFDTTNHRQEARYHTFEEVLQWLNPQSPTCSIGNKPLRPYKIKNNAGEVHDVHKYIHDDEGQEHIWCDNWYGHHVIGKDCEWYDESGTDAAVDRVQAINLTDIDAPIFTHTKEFAAHFSYIKGKMINILKQSKNK